MRYLALPGTNKRVLGTTSSVAQATASAIPAVAISEKDAQSRTGRQGEIVDVLRSYYVAMALPEVELVASALAPVHEKDESHDLPAEQGGRR
jgi:hypothetical protein